MFRLKPDFDPRGISSPFWRTFLYFYPEKPVIELGRITAYPSFCGHTVRRFPFYDKPTICPMKHESMNKSV